MIKSMTGFGKAEVILASGKLTVEIRTLNGKNADVNIKTSLVPKEKELGLRQKLVETLKRGTIDFFINYEADTSGQAKNLNASLFKEYYQQIKDLQQALYPGGDNDSRLDGEVFAAILRFPEIMDSKKQDCINEENWPGIEAAIDKAIAAVNAYRETEGASLYKDVTERVANILRLEDIVESFEPERIEAVKTKVLKALSEMQQKPDQSRFEQEMIYYLEKLDINEEKVRLRQHCKFFLDIIEKEGEPGRKLGFIIQEMGREINTTGSKANHAGIQKTVVLMKDELEKIRELSLNIL